jgi:curved DNA-binding protein CbpA
MIDHFAVLGIERRPFVSKADAEEAYHEKSKSLHRDQARVGDFSSVNAAFQVVSNPAERIRHLLKIEFGESGDRQIGAELGNLFGTVVNVLRQADQEISFLSEQTSPVLRALAFQRLSSLREGLERVEKQIATRESELHTRIATLDHAWFNDPGQCRKPLAQISVDLTFVQKWLAQVRERKIRLEELFDL